MKNIIYILLVIPFLGFSQKKIERSLIGIRTLQQAEKFIEAKKDVYDSKILKLDIGEEQTPLAKELSELPIGKLKIVENGTSKTVYKVIDTKKTRESKMSLMEFDSKKTTLSEINSLRAFILKGIKNGEHKFHNLARVYSSHPSAPTGGDIGWVKEGTFSKRFDLVVAKKKKGQVFSFDEHRERKHYILMKTEDDKITENLIVLVVSSKS